ncbi:MAG: 5-oxoprolinase subunit PxpA [Verrucomicrobiota bacterium]
MQRIDLNCDLGEGGAHDAELMPLISSANIACGGHAGDEATMRTTIRLALAHGVAIGAHPGYEDREHMGRRPMNLSPDAIGDLVSGQLKRFAQIAHELGAPIHHVKAHGALYNQADTGPLIANAIANAIRNLLPQAMVYAPPNGCMMAAAKSAGLRFRAEGFIDRRYNADGSLVPRGQAGAVIHDPAAACAQALEMLLERKVTSISGFAVPIEIDSLCVHGDSDSALEILNSTRLALESAGLQVCH